MLKRQQLNFFSIFFHRKTPEQQSHYNKISYLKPAILLKKRLQHRCFTVSFSEFCRTATLLITSQGDYFWFHASLRITMLSLIKICKIKLNDCYLHPSDEQRFRKNNRKNTKIHLGQERNFYKSHSTLF